MWKTIVGVCVASIVLQMVDANATVDTSGNREQIIANFFHYIDVVARIKLDNMLDLVESFVTQLLASIPPEHHGNSARRLENFLQSLDRAQDTTSNYKKRNVLLELENLVMFIRNEMTTQEVEDVYISRGLVGMLELLARCSLEEMQFARKVVGASRVLQQHLPPSEEQKYAELLNVLRAYEQHDDIIVREQLMSQFREIRAKYFPDPTPTAE